MTAYPILELSGAAAELELAVSILDEWSCLGIEEKSPRRFRAYFPETTDLTELVSSLGRRLPGIRFRVLASIPERDWLGEWRKSLSGFALGESFFVRPTWRPAPVIERHVLSLDPQRAFGTGAHDTTRLAVQLLERWCRRDVPALDLGAGTGILAMVAAVLGARPVLALEPDPAASECARRNVRLNGLSSAIRIVQAHWEELDGWSDGGLAVANINAPALAGVFERVPADTWILSGLLHEEVDELRRSFPPSREIREVWTAGEWAALVATESRSPGRSSR